MADGFRKHWKSEGVPWGEEEDAILWRWYPKKGVDRTVEALRERGFDRTREAVHGRVTRLGAEHDPSLTYRGELVFTRDVHPRSSKGHGWTHARIVREAEADGVITRGEVYPYRLMVPSWWADEYLERLMREVEHAEWLRDNWIRTAVVAQAFGVTRRTLENYISPGVRRSDHRMSNLTIHKHIDAIPKEWANVGVGNGMIRGMFWDPDVARREAERYRIRQATRMPGKRKERYLRSLVSP